MKHFLFLLMFLAAGICATYARTISIGYDCAEYASPSGDTEGNENCLVLWHKEGYCLYYFFTEKPVVTFADSNVHVEGSTTSGDYDFEAIDKMTYEFVDPAGIKGVESKDAKSSFSRSGEFFVFESGDKALQVKVVSVNGIVVKNFTVDAGTTQMLPVDSLPRGINIIYVNGSTYKINVR